MRAGEIRLSSPVLAPASAAAGQAPVREEAAPLPQDGLELSPGQPATPKPALTSLVQTALATSRSLSGWPVEETAEKAPPPAENPLWRELLKTNDSALLRDGLTRLSTDPHYGPAAQLALEASAGIKSTFGQSTTLKAALLYPQMGTPEELRKLARYMIGSCCEGAGPVVFGRLAQQNPEWAEGARFATELAEQSGPGKLTVYQIGLNHLEARTPEQKLAFGREVMAELRKSAKFMGDDGPTAQAALGAALMPLLASQPGGSAAAELAQKAARSTTYESAQAAVYAAVLDNPNVDDLHGLAQACLAWTSPDEPARVLVEELGRRKGAGSGAALVLDLWPRCRRNNTRVALAQAILAHPNVSTPHDVSQLAYQSLNLAGKHYYGGCREDQARLGEAFLELLEAQPATCQAAQKGLQDLRATIDANDQVKVVMATLIATNVPPEQAGFVRGLADELTAKGRTQLYSLIPAAPPLSDRSAFLQFAFQEQSNPVDRSQVGGHWLAIQEGPRADLIRRLMPSASPGQQVAWLELLAAAPPASDEVTGWARRLVQNPVDPDDQLRAPLVAALAESIQLADAPGLAASQLKLSEVMDRIEKAAQEAEEVRHLSRHHATAGLQDEAEGVRLPGVRLRKRG